MNTHTIKGKNIALTFDESSLSVEKIFSGSTKVCSNASQKIYIRTSDAVFEPVLINKINKVLLEEDKITYSLQDEKGDYKINLIAATSSKGIKFSVKCRSKKPVWLFEWKLDGLDFEKVIVPSLGGQEISKEMTEGSTLSYKYPFWWNSQFVLGMFKRAGLILRSEDSGTSLKLLRVSKEEEKFSLVFGFEAKAPLKKKEFYAEWFLDSFGKDWKEGADIHRSWMEKTFNLVPYKKHPHFPKWGSDINFVLELWGARRDKEMPQHSFAQMRDRIDEFAKLHNPKNTLLYIPGFAEHGIDSNAPSYNPSKQCGGDEEFALLVKHAHKLGYKVMIHTNVLAMTFTHPMYEKFKKYQVIDVFDRKQGWAMDMDGDWLTEPYFAYMNPGFKEWGNYMSKVLGELIEKYKLDGVFLDQTLLAFNISKGPDFIEGMVNHIQKLQSSYPKVLFAGEGLHELNVRALPMAQIHGIDSIAEVHGMEGQINWRKAHPISSYLFGKYTRYTAHLLTKHPSHPMFALQEESYAKLNVIPALCLYNNNQALSMPEVKKMIQRGKKLKG